MSAFAQEAPNFKCHVSKDLIASHQGCCSHHSGVCGCGGYRLQCCDGTLSPSCPCLTDDETKLDAEEAIEQNDNSNKS